MRKNHTKNKNRYIPEDEESENKEVQPRQPRVNPPKLVDLQDSLKRPENSVVSQPSEFSGIVKPDLPITLETPKNVGLIKPREDCEICRGKGFMYEDPKLPPVDCDCILILKVLAYVTPIYANAFFDRNFKPEPYINKNLILIENEVAFKSFVKSFLLRTGMEYKHNTLTASQITQIFFDKINPTNWENLIVIPLLILFLSSEPPHKYYGPLIKTLIERRTLVGNPIWIFTRFHLNSDSFRKIYSFELADFLEQACQAKQFYCFNPGK